MGASDGFCYIGQESCKLHMGASDVLFCYITLDKRVVSYIWKLLMGFVTIGQEL